MTTEEVHLKIKNNLNKLDSHDYDNIDSWQINLAFNTAQNSWVRRNLHGMNYFREGDESSKMRIDDFQVLLQQKELQLQKKDKYYECYPLPQDYMLFKRIDVKVQKECCEENDIVVYLTEHANINVILNDVLRKPSFEWRETICTLMDNKIQVWTNNEFDITKCILTYYMLPPEIELIGTYNIRLQAQSTQTVNPIFKDDVVEIIIAEACKLIAGNIELVNQINIQSNNTEQNN